MALYAKRIEGQRAMYRLHQDGCQAVRRKGTPVRVDHARGCLVMEGDYPLPIWPREIGKRCRSCKASVSLEVPVTETPRAD